MAAYAALVSLKQILQNRSNVLGPLGFICRAESLKENIDFLLDFVESYKSYVRISNERAEELESQIASAAHLAEDVIESHGVNQIRGFGSETIEDLNFTCRPSLQHVRCIKEKVLKIKEINDQNPTTPTPAASSTPLTKGESSMVGFDDELHQLMDVLTGQGSRRKIVSIVGMGGTGKTTLARNVYESSLIMNHFDFCAWTTISQEYSVREILLQLLSFQRKITDDESVDELGERLHRCLFGRRYLIILDDLWGIDLWDYIKFFFPDNDQGSRVVLTTRLSNVATHLRSFCIRINFLDEHNSWNLFCQEVFGKETCPHELVGIGKNIVEQCKGLPLTIVVIGGLLRKSFRTCEYWHYVSENINSILNSRENEQCLDVLYLSYSHLPSHLKPCFLYLGTYREDYEISVSEVIKLWVAEGFLNPNGAQNIEEMAEDYLKDLIDRNLVLVSAHRSNGKIRSCRIHDLLRELCLRVAHKEKFFCAVREDSIPQGVDRERRLIFHDETSSNHQKEVFKALQSASLARTVMCNLTEVPVMCKLLRVLKEVVDRSTEAKIRNFNLRYVAYLHPAWSVLPSSISMLQDLETLIITSTEESDQVIVAPLEIWHMWKLRHLKCTRILLPDPPCTKNSVRSDWGNLWTLATTVNFRLSVEACKRLAKIKKLRIAYGNKWSGYDDHLNYDLQNLCSLHKLESLHIFCFNTISINELKDAFPRSLNKLSLTDCSVHWGDLSMIIGSLPVLEVLKLKKPLCEVCNWSCVEGGFLRLKFLQIESCALRSWTSNSPSCFPVLEKLVLVDLWDLNEIPSSIGEIPTLQLIRLEDCTESAAISAMKINEEQEYFGNDGLKIQVIMSPGNSLGFRQTAKEKGLLVNNIHLQTWSEEDEDEDKDEDED